MVTVSVGSDISELRSLPARARSTSPAEIAHQLVEFFGVDVVDRRCDEAAFALRHSDAKVNAVGMPKAAVDPEPIDLRDLACSQRHRLEQKDGRHEPLGDAAFEVGLGQPGQRAFHVDLGAKVVMGDLALGPRHKDTDGLAHGDAAVGDLSGCCDDVHIYLRRWCHD